MVHVILGILPTSPNWCCYTTLWKSKHWQCSVTAGYYRRKLHQMCLSFTEVDHSHVP